MFTGQKTISVGDPVYAYLYYKLNFSLPLVLQKYIYMEKTISVGDPVYTYL